ncbi:MAG: hypothetical protein ACI4W6_02310 [Acutalibacteraceae bacterium]
MCDAIEFFSGEVKYITACVHTRNPNDTVVISSAKYELFDMEKNIIESGECETEKNNIKLLLGVSTCGMFYLKITAKIGRETVIQKVRVAVRE